MQAANMVLEAVEWVQKTHPKIWQRRGGRDHIYLIPNDEGAESPIQRVATLPIAPESFFDCCYECPSCAYSRSQSLT